MAYILIFITAIFVNNIVLSQFLGICPFLGVSKKVETALGMGAAVAFVLTLATIVTYLIQVYVLDAFGLVYLRTIAFILIIAALVQMVEIVLKKVSPSLYQALGVFLPLITTNCCILGVAILVAQGTYNTQGLEPNLLTGVVYAIATALGIINTKKLKTLKTPIFLEVKMKLNLQEILSTEEVKNNRYFRGSIELALLNKLYKEKQLSDREYVEIRERIKKMNNIY